MKREPITSAISWIAAGVALNGLVFGFTFAGSLTAHSQGPIGFSFGLIGDLGYSPRQEPWFDNVMADLNRDTSLSFVVHVGDLSTVQYACTNDLQAKRLAQFQASVHPLIYTPGDNDWTDCHDPPAGRPEYGVPGGNPLERLSHLRATFFQGEQSLGLRKLPLTRQSRNPSFARYRENVQWEMGGVLFLALHVVGSNNGLGRWPEGDAEYAERTTANLAWLRDGFEYAKASNSPAVMLLMQANIFPDFPPFDGGRVQKGRSGFTEIREAIEKETITFRKPVILVHGDSHYFRLDNPLRPRPVPGQPSVPSLENFMRLETFGTPNHHWVRVGASPNDSSVFTIRPRIVTENVVKRQ